MGDFPSGLFAGSISSLLLVLSEKYNRFGLFAISNGISHEKILLDDFLGSISGLFSYAN